MSAATTSRRLGPAVWFLRHPWLAVILLVALLAGGLYRLSTLYLVPPSILLAPRIAIEIKDPGMPVGLMEDRVVRPIETRLTRLAPGSELSSHIRDGRANLNLWFDSVWQRDRALAPVRASLEESMAALPASVERPAVHVDRPEDFPVAEILLSSAQRSPTDLRVWAERSFRHQLLEIDGVASVDIRGGAAREIQVVLDQRRLAALGLSPEDIVDVLRADRYAIKGLTAAESAGVAAVSAVTVPLASGDDLALSELARVRARAVEADEQVWLDDRAAVRVLVYRSAGRRFVELSDAVRARLAWLQTNRQLPADVRIALLPSASNDLKRSARRFLAIVVLTTLVIGALSALVLRAGRPAFAIALSIPLSVIAWFIAVPVLGLTLNPLTLGGASLALGFAPCCALVLHRAMASGHAHAQQEEAAARVLYGILWALVSIAVFCIPVVALPGPSVWLNRELATAFISLALIGMGLTWVLSPALARAAPTTAAHRPITPWAQGVGALIGTGPRRVWCGVALLVMFAIVLTLGLPAARHIGWLNTLAMDQINIRVARITDYDPAALESLRRDLAKFVHGLGTVAQIVSVHHVPQTSSRIDEALSIRVYRPARTTEPIDTWRRAIQDHLDAKIAWADVQVMPALFPGVAMDASDMEWRRTLWGETVIRLSAEDRTVLERVVTDWEQALRRGAGVKAARRAAGSPIEHLSIEMDMERTAQWGLDIGTLARILHLARDGLVVGDVLEGDHRTRIRLRLSGMSDARPDEIGRALVRGETSEHPVITLQDVAQIAVEQRVVERRRFNGTPAAEIELRMADDIAAAQTLTVLRGALGDLSSAPDVRWTWSGAAAVRDDVQQRVPRIAFAAVGIALLLAVLRYHSWRYLIVVLIPALGAAAGAALTLMGFSDVVSMWFWPFVLAILGWGFGLGWLLLGELNAQQRQPRSGGATRPVASRAVLPGAVHAAAIWTLCLSPLVLRLAHGFEWLQIPAIGLLLGMWCALIASVCLVPLVYDVLWSRWASGGGANPRR